jgi:hypothetical protein
MTLGGTHCFTHRFGVMDCGRGAESGDSYLIVVSGGTPEHLVRLGPGLCVARSQRPSLPHEAAVIRQSPMRPVAAAHGNDLPEGQPTASRAATIVAIGISVDQSGGRVNGVQ